MPHVAMVTVLPTDANSLIVFHQFIIRSTERFPGCPLMIA